MRLKQLTLALFLTLGLAASAANEKTTVTQVTDAVQLTTDVDYIISGDTPFTTAGSVDIQNTEHAVLIISSIKPSLVLSNWMDYIYINGQKAVDGTNCQVKMYNRGTIIFPYASNIQPLTCYTETNFAGESCSNYSEGHSGGFMKTLTDNLLNNKIRSFKLKRGYMVTFAIGTGGWGYSRCFIADQEDLEVSSLPKILDQKISSYRIFKWFNAHKAGIGDSNDQNAINALGASWCYRMWPDPQGLNYLPDCEYVPHHYKENYPTYGSLGTKEFSCHIKGNNEPGNSADEGQCDVDAVLANWEEGMRTGMRLLSESSHDGSMSHLKAFIDSIDARGWRCDILDLHCYWPSGTFDNLTWYSDYYGNKRPIWISEWVWGASWNNNGIFGAVSDKNDYSKANQQTCYNGTKPILDVLNSNTRVERYAYWNSEAPASKIYNGGLSILGEYYATMNDGIGYNAANDFIPKDTRLGALSTLTCNYNRTKKTAALTWTDPNGELSEKITVQCKLPGTTTYKDIATITSKDKNSSSGVAYSYTDTPSEPGSYIYRVKAVTYNNKTLYSGEATINVDPAQGTSEIQYGKLVLDNLDENTIYYSESFSETPCVFIGTITNKNSSFYAGNVTASKSSKSSFTYQLFPWQTNSATSLKNNEEIPFLALKATYNSETYTYSPRHYQFGDLDCEVGLVKSEKASTNSWTDTTTVVFATPFPEGVIPVVLTEIKKPSYTSGSTKTTLCPRIFDVTNTGFKFIIYSEDASGRTVGSGQNVSYLAITPGIGTADEENEIIIAAGHGVNSAVYGSSLRENAFYLQSYDETEQEMKSEQLYLYKPTIFTALQTNNYPAVCMLRRTDVTTTDGDGTTWTTGVKVKRIMDHNLTVDGTTVSTTTTNEKYQDMLGWVAIATYQEGGSAPTAIQSLPIEESSMPIKPYVSNGRIYLNGIPAKNVYNITGKQVTNTTLSNGIYIVKTNGKSIKVLVK